MASNSRKLWLLVFNYLRIGQQLTFRSTKPNARLRGKKNMPSRSPVMHYFFCVCGRANAQKSLPKRLVVNVIS